MISQIPRAPNPKSPLTGWLNRLVASVTSIAQSKSETLSVTQTRYGMKLEINPAFLPNKNAVSWTDTFKAANGADIGMITNKDIDSVITDEDGNKYESPAGTYICVSPVPPDVILDGNASDYMTAYFTGIKRDPKVIYGPVYPYISDTLAHEKADGKGKYWHLIAFAPKPTTTCDPNGSGNQITQLVQESQSGSLLI